MKYLPIYLDLDEKRIVVSGAGSAASAKLRVLVRTDARIAVFGAPPDDEVQGWAQSGRITWLPRPPEAADVREAELLYCASGDPEEDRRVASIGRRLSVPVNVADNLQDSQFITPAIVDRDPVVVAIGTEGSAPLLASHLRARLEEVLPSTLGALARIGKRFQAEVRKIPGGFSRRTFWSEFYFRSGPRSLAQGGGAKAEQALRELLDEKRFHSMRRGRVSLVGAGPGDPELLTMKARNRLLDADVVIHDRLVPSAVLELARREAQVIATGKTGFKPSWKQEDINRLMIEAAETGRQVVRLKSGDPSVFARLDEEIDSLDAAGIDWEIVPGITAASAAAATMGVSLTRRGRNSDVRFATGHDAEGFSRQDWDGLAKAGAVTAVYMGRRAASYLRGCLMMHGASADTPVTVVENASRPDERTVASTLLGLPEIFKSDDAPAVIFIGLAPRTRGEDGSAHDLLERRAG